MENINRRGLLRTGLGTIAGLASTKAIADAVCPVTVPQGEGPYYPESDLDRDNDLIQHKEGMPVAKGQIIEVRGQVTDTECNPIADAVVEVWQACESGKYNHSEDPNNLEFDPNFQYWGRTRTDVSGNYLFRSIIPGHYPTGPGTFRPPHIHYKAHAPGHRSLTTQLYFDPMTYEDLELRKIVDRLNKAEGVDKRLTVLFTKKESDPRVKTGKFDISLRRN